MGSGCCAASERLSDNDAENFIQDCLKCIKTRDFSIYEISAMFLLSFDTEERLANSDIYDKTQYIYFNEEKFEQFANHIFVDRNDGSRNPYEYFQMKLTPKYMEIIENDTYELNIYAYMFSLVRKDDIRRMFELILERISTQQSITISVFKEFLRKYLEICLITFTSKISHGIEEKVKAPQVILIENHVIDLLLFSSCRELLSNFYTKGVINNVCSMIFKELDKITLNSNLIDLRHVMKLNEAFPWLFEYTSLRLYVYSNIRSFL